MACTCISSIFLLNYEGKNNIPYQIDEIEAHLKISKLSEESTMMEVERVRVPKYVATDNGYILV
ncbi:hypothetical protein GCM10012290_25020 [Halolactibacillus alkaliphilus]|uniref:Uncharacterized protein n=1 Tax=Halolactibacillus alkaliphilus TaxID=442899 RepID=A0A511X4R4_9BACI|nr:hypothetical protein HAL01_24040 [Halolactibacillus alkaliphilus]GGN75849.1 hypothetical protein GCM10012290_25020 [Halolactibacillus alkaliphilus]